MAVKYFTKDAIVTAPINSAIIPHRETDVGSVERYIIHLLTKPLKGGTPIIEREPTSAVNAVIGIDLANPPKLSRSLLPVL